MTHVSGFFVEPGALLFGAAVLGLLAGYAFYLLWRLILPSARRSALLARLPADVRAMLTAEEPSEMLKHYKAVLVGISSFGLRNAAALAVGLLPVAASFVLLTAVDPSGRVAREIEAHPAEGVRHSLLAGASWKLRDDRALVARGEAAVAGFPLVRPELDANGLSEKLALCASMPACMLFDMMLFETEPAADLARSVVVRPVFLDANPLWPYVNDLELAFFIAVMLGSGAAMRVHRGEGAA